MHPSRCKLQTKFIAPEVAPVLGERFFLEPVTEASINSEPLTRRVPVNGAKSERLPGPGICHTRPFFTPQETSGFSNFPDFQLLLEKELQR